MMMSKSQADRVPPKNILVPMDFSGCSRAGLEAAKILASRWASRVEIVHVDPGVPTGLSENADSHWEQHRLKGYYDYLESWLKEAAEGISSAQSRITDGDPAKVLSTIAADAGTDLVVMGTHGYTGLSRFMLGSVAERVVHVSRVPVLTVHAKPKPGWPGKILVPMKFADYADEALLYAFAWARGFGASLSVLHVIDDLEDGDKEERAALEEHLQRLLGKETYDRLDRIIYNGQPDENILKAAEAGRFDLIVLAAHRKPFWKDMILGTTAERVLRRSAVPVVSVPSVSPTLSGEG